MNLSELTPRQRKIIKLIVQGNLDIGHLVNEDINLDDAIDLVNQGYLKVIDKRIVSTTDDINT